MLLFYVIPYSWIFLGHLFCDVECVKGLLWFVSSGVLWVEDCVMGLPSAGH